MRIAFFVQYSHQAGTYFRWHNLAKAAVLLGHTVDVYAGDFNFRAKKRIEIRDGIKYFIRPSLFTVKLFGNPSDPFTALSRAFTSVEKNYDCYHLFQPFLQAFLPWFFLKMKRRGLFLFDWDDLWIGGLFQHKPHDLRGWYTYKMVSFLERNLPMMADGVTTCSGFLKNMVNPEKNVCIIYNGYTPRQNISGKSILKKEKEIVYLGYIGKTAAEILWLVSLAQKISERKIAAKLIIVGPDLQTIQDSNILSLNNVIYLNEVSPEEAAILSSEIDLGLLPLANNAFNASRFPIKFFDYLTAGTPVCFSGVGELKIVGEQILQAFDCGTNMDVWVNAVCEVISLFQHSKIPVINTEEIATAFTWQENGKNLIHFYNAHAN